MSTLLPLINQITDLKQKITKEKNDQYERNWVRIFDFLEQNNYIIQVPLGEKYDENRTDCEASIVGKLTDNMAITQVIKPIVYFKENGTTQLVQKGVVIVEKA